MNDGPINGTCQLFWGSFLSIAARIKEERERLGLNQTQLAALAGSTKKTQIRWEQEGGASPDAEALAAWARIGVDVQYIVTGERCSGALTPDEKELLEKFRAAPLAIKAAAFAAITAGSDPQARTVKQIFHGPVGQSVEGGITNEQGVTFNVGNTKSKE